MKFFFALFLFLSISYLAASQTILLERQGQVDSFVCASNIHSIQIGSAIKDSDIHDISKLSCIQSLWGVGLVVVNNPHLKSLNGLQNIHSINGALIIKKNDSLTNLIGLPPSYNCTEPTDYWRYISIGSNNSLNTLEGFPTVNNLNLIGIGGNLSLTSLAHIPSIQGLNKLGIGTNNLTNLTSLPNFDTIFEKLYITATEITSLHGLDSLKFCQEIILKNVNNIVNLEGLGNLDSVRTFTIESCDKLQNFAGLNNLRAVYSLEISENNALQNFSGIENTDKIEQIEIINNPALVNLIGLDSVEIMESFVCKDNPNLISMDELSAQVTGQLKIENCNNLQHINKTHGAATWGISIKNNPRLKNYGPFPNVIPFNSQNIEITLNDSLNSVEGLMGLKRVESSYSNDGKLRLAKNPSLETLKGLDSLSFVGKHLSLQDNHLIHLQNLSSLDSVGYNLIFFDKNPFTSLHGLESLKYIGNGTGIEGDSISDISALADNLRFCKKIAFYRSPIAKIEGFDQLNIDTKKMEISITGHPNLKAITGFNHIDTIYGLTNYIGDNDSLETFLAFSNSIYSNGMKLYENPNLTDISGLCRLFTEGTIAGTLDIYDNAEGFNSIQEIKDWCITPTEDLPTYDAITVFPNPATSELFIDVPMELIQVGMMVDLLDISGVSHFSARLKGSVSRIPTEDLAPGLYFLRMVYDGRLVEVRKVVVGE